MTRDEIGGGERVGVVCTLGATFSIAGKLVAKAGQASQQGTCLSIDEDFQGVF